MNGLGLVPQERLNIYSSILQLKDHERMGGYLWNKALSSAMTPLLQCLEITLRNSINNAIQMKDRSTTGWQWRSNDRWIHEITKEVGDRLFNTRQRYKKDKQGNTLKDKNGSPIYNRMTVHEKSILKIIKRLMNSNRKVTLGGIISNTTFGFWTEILSKNYEDTRQDALLWPTLTNDVFPNKPASIKRGHIYEKMLFFKDIRNRLSHHEAIWKFHRKQPDGKIDYTSPIYGRKASIKLLRRSYNEMLEVIGWMDNKRKEEFLDSGLDHRFKLLATNDGLNSYIYEWNTSGEKAKFKTVDVSELERYIDISDIENHLRRGKIISINKNGKEAFRIGWDLMRLNLKV